MSLAKYNSYIKPEKRGGGGAGKEGSSVVQHRVSVHHRVQTGCEAHTTSYPMRTRGSFSCGKTVEA